VVRLPGWLAGVRASFVVFFFFVGVASFLPGTRLWGVNHLAFYPVWLRVASLALVALALLPPARSLVESLFDRIAGAVSGRGGIVAAIAAAVIALVLFIVFASATELLGDGLYTANNIVRAARVDHDVFVTVLKHPYPIYPGTEMLTLSVGRLCLEKLGAAPLGAVRVLNAVLGAILVLVVVAGARRSRPAQRGTDIALGALVLLTGGIQIFFGYIEAYAPLLFFAGLYVWAAHRTLSRGAGLRGPVVFALAATAMHLLGCLLLPSLALLASWVSFGRKFSSRFFHASWLLAAGTLTLPFLAVDVAGLGRLFLPLVRGNYAALSPAHLADVANELVLLFPGVLVLGIAAVMVLVETLRPALRGENGRVFEAFARVDAGAPVFLPRLFFAVLLAIPAFLFLFFFKPELGIVRDWDLFAVTGLGPLLFVTTVLGSVDTGSPAERAVRVILPPVLVMTAVLTASWIGVNADPQRAATRFERTLSYDRARAGYAYESLASFYKERGETAAGIRALEKAAASSSNPRYLFALGLDYYDAGEKEKAVAALERCLALRPGHDRARQNLVRMLYEMGRDEEVLRVCEEGARLDPKQWYYPFFIGKSYARGGRADDARKAFDKCRALEPPPEVMREMDDMLRSLEDTNGGEEPRR
jgi:hypothetical protein